MQNQRNGKLYDRKTQMWDYDLNFHAENMHQQPRSIPLSKRIIRDTSLEPPLRDECLARGAYRTWENVSMQNALKAVDKGVPIRHAAELYNVP